MYYNSEWFYGIQMALLNKNTYKHLKSNNKIFLEWLCNLNCSKNKIDFDIILIDFCDQT